MQIDSELERQLEREPDKTVDMILVCSACSVALQTEIERTGFHITNREHAGHGLIYGRMRLADLKSLKKIKAIESVSPDSTQYAL
ncbi:MAG: hypothetical protein ACE5I1_23975 [bacterium]